MRGLVAHHWGVDPFVLRRYPARDYRMMVQIRERMVREHNEAVKAAQQGGLPPQKKPGPKSRDDF